MGNLRKAPSPNLNIIIIHGASTFCYLMVVKTWIFFFFELVIRRIGWLNHTQLSKQRKIFLFLSCSCTPPSNPFSDCCSRNSRTIGVCERSCIKEKWGNRKRNMKIGNWRREETGKWRNTDALNGKNLLHLLAILASVSWTYFRVSILVV